MIEKPHLPFNSNDLMPFISEETIDFHYGKHHLGYYNKLIGMLKDRPDLANMNLIDLIRHSHGRDDMVGIFNNAAQIYNHSLFWDSLSVSPQKCCSTAAKLIQDSFGDLDHFKKEFSSAAAGLFGSGWVWLVKNSAGKLEIITTQNAKTPITNPTLTPLLVLDVWEHAYYIDHRNNRPQFIEDFVDHMINWDNVCKILGKVCH